MSKKSRATCMYGFSHDDHQGAMNGFACDRESHARAAVFGGPRPMQMANRSERASG